MTTKTVSPVSASPPATPAKLPEPTVIFLVPPPKEASVIPLPPVTPAPMVKSPQAEIVPLPEKLTPSIVSAPSAVSAPSTVSVEL